MVLILDNPVYSASDIGIACLGQSSRCYFHFRSKSSSPLPFLGAEPVQIHWPFGENKHLHLASAIKLGRKRRLDHSDREATFPTVRINRIVISKQNCHPPLHVSVQTLYPPSHNEYPSFQVQSANPGFPVQASFRFSETPKHQPR